MNLSDLGSPAAIISSIFIGIVGFAIFLYGKKELNVKCIGTGITLCIFPYFVHSVLLMWTITAACLAALYWLSKNA